MRRAIVLSRVSTLQQDLKQQTEEILREVYKDGFKEEEVILIEDKESAAIHCQIRKITKNKGIFPNDTALIKLVYLAYRNARKKWTMPVPNWGIISQQLAIKFEDRYNLL